MLMRGLLSRGVVMIVVLSVAGAVAQVPDRASDPERLIDFEPITPIPAPPPADPRKVMLGDRLFHDPRLSHDGAVACSSCHDMSTNGANSSTIGPGSSASGGMFNTPTVFNAALNFRLNWEGNYRTLEDQGACALSEPGSMAKSIDADIASLAQDNDVVRDFEAAYGHQPDRDSLLDAIATYERSLLTPDSPFDRWLRGDAEALSAEAVSGYTLFKSFGCISCHQGVNVGGNLFEQSGVFHPLASAKPMLLRVPSLRNVAVTPPYFHDGSAPTLQDAVRRMGYAQLDRTMSDEQIDKIVAFLDSLTGLHQGKPLTRAP
jgi:cytochrome c peroxidase